MKLLKRCTLLIAEDNKVTQAQLRRLLEDKFQQIYQAYDGLEALQVYHEKTPDIILADITMPHMDGLSMAREIKSEDPFQPVLLLTGHSGQETVLAAANVPVDGYITKPIASIEHLLKSLIQAAERLQHQRSTRESEIALVRDAYEKEVQILRYRSHYDHLTRMPNRYLFTKRLADAIERARLAHSTVALFYIDLDHLKQINDQFGHRVGDHAIKMAVNNIQDIVHTQNVFARIGGDEFALIVETVDESENLEKLAQAILKAVSRPVYYQHMSLNLTCSIGISRFPLDATERHELIHRADMAMYRAKANGKNGYLFWE